jgi:hypothetical protein
MIFASEHFIYFSPDKYNQPLPYHISSLNLPQIEQLQLQKISRRAD